ncbi:cell death protein hid [Toxorhynchites rutilus septentrionalis]|uniref:cell death protein hid n=1 Tax=Toxorhynchites rutilus septentrionalis TaxID=329112 RepID=UPI00247A31C4|nr:cell death protein hid [Toxorhynchites rutilus septentrionalis]
MAIPFLQPDEDDSIRHNGNGTASSGNGSGTSGSTSSGGIGGGSAAAAAVGGSTSGAVGNVSIPSLSAPIGTSTGVQTPLISPVFGDQLVHLFYEALYRYTRGDTPSTPISQSPQSSSCSPFTTGYYNGQVFFPQTPNGVHRAGGGGRGAVFFGQPTPSPSGSSHSSHGSAANSPDTPSCSSALPFFHQFPSSFPVASGGSSTVTPAAVASASAATTRTTWNDDGDESSESDSSQATTASAGCSPHCLGLSSHHHHHHHHHHQLHQLNDGGTMGLMPASGFIPPHLDYMAGREQLQEFTGKIPQRKKKSKANKSKKTRFLEHTLVWPTLAVTAMLIALGCGLFAAR